MNLKSAERRVHDEWNGDEFVHHEEITDEDDHHDGEGIWFKGPGASGNELGIEDHDDDDDEKNEEYYIDEYFNNNIEAGKLEDLLNFLYKIRFRRLFTTIFNFKI